MSFKEFMEEAKPVSRFRIMSVFLGGITCGAILMVLMILLEILSI